MTSIGEAQAQWQAIRSKGRVRGIVALVLAVVVLLGIALAAGGNAGIVVGVLVALVVVVLVVGMVLSQRKTGLSITPEWAPKEGPATRFDDGDEDDGEAPSSAPAAAEPAEPVRSFDGQMLGSALADLGQQVAPKLAKSYALGTISIQNAMVSWTPSTVSTGQGVQPLSAPAGAVAVVERAPLWGSWALLRIELTDGPAWAFRVPSSVDLGPALAEVGISYRQVEAAS